MKSIVRGPPSSPQPGKARDSCSCTWADSVVISSTFDSPPAGSQRCSLVVSAFGAFASCTLPVLPGLRKPNVKQIKTSFLQCKVHQTQLWSYLGFHGNSSQKQPMSATLTEKLRKTRFSHNFCRSVVKRLREGRKWTTFLEKPAWHLQQKENWDFKKV